MATDAVESKFDWLKWLIAFAIFGGGIYGYYYYADFPLLYRVLALLGVVVISLFVAYQTETGRVVWVYVSESRAELRKVVWPTKVETWQTVIIIAVVVVLVALFLWFLDWLIGIGLDAALGVGG